MMLERSMLIWNNIGGINIGEEKRKQLKRNKRVYAGRTHYSIGNHGYFGNYAGVDVKYRG